MGYGFRAGYEAYLPFISLESEVNFFPTTSGGDLGETQAFFGLKFGKKIGSWGGFVKVRPGFTHFGGGAFPTRLTEHTKFALDLGGGIEYDLVPESYASPGPRRHQDLLRRRPAADGSRRARRPAPRHAPLAPKQPRPGRPLLIAETL